MTYNKNVKKYIKQCKYLFASYGKSEKEYIRKGCQWWRRQYRRSAAA